MTTIFLICAVVGGTVLVAQFVMTLIGLGGDALGVDLPGDLDGEPDSVFSGDGLAGAQGDPGAIFRILSFRTVVAALAFFGIGGLAADSIGASPAATLLVATGSGALALVAVYWLMRGVCSLKSDGTARIERTVGRHGTVYVSIPARRDGSGKIQMNLQNRTMEFDAVTDGARLVPGAKVMVVDVVTPSTVAVEPIEARERNEV